MNRGLAGNLPALILIFCLISGCSTAGISRETKINEDEGMLITKVHSNIKFLKVFIMEEDGKDYLAELFSPDEDVRVIPLKNGKACFGRLVRYGLVFNYYTVLKPYYFYIEPGSITYVGDLFVNWTATNIIGGGYAQVSISDREEQTVAEAKERYPELFEKFQYRKSVPIPIQKIDNVEEFNETEDTRELIEKIR